MFFVLHDNTIQLKWVEILYLDNFFFHVVGYKDVGKTFKA
jgi:hypothetical protein